MSRRKQTTPHHISDDESPGVAKSTMSPVERVEMPCAVKREAPSAAEPSERSGLRPRHLSDGTPRLKFARLKDAVAALAADENGSPPPPAMVTPPTSSRNCCPYCGLLKKGPADLQRHLRKHTGERPFVCKVCQKAFKAKRSLCHHEYVHHGLDDHTDGRLAINSARRRHGARQRLSHISLAGASPPGGDAIGLGLTTQLQEISQRAKCGSDTNNNQFGGGTSTAATPGVIGANYNAFSSRSPPAVWGAVRGLSSGDEGGASLMEQPVGRGIFRGYPPVNGNTPRAVQKFYPCRVCGKRFRVRSSLLFHERLAHYSSRTTRRTPRLHYKPSGGNMSNCFNGVETMVNGWGESAGEHSTNGEMLAHQMSKRRMAVVSETSVVTLITGVSTADGHAVELYRCHLCSGRLFRSLTSLLRHLASHSSNNDVPDRHIAYYPCDYCDAAFRFRVRLNRHLATRHGIDAESWYSNDCCSNPLEKSLASEIREQASLADDVTVVIPADVPDDTHVNDPDVSAQSADMVADGHASPPPLIDVIGTSPVKTIIPSPSSHLCNTRGSQQPPTLSVEPMLKTEKEEEDAEDEDDYTSPGRGSSLSKTHSRLHVVNAPIGRDVVCRPTVLADGRAVYRCTYCHKHFATHSDINRHMDFHEDIRPYKCHFCDYFARTNSQLKVHMMRHQGIREFHCKLCNYKGVTQSDLNRHTKSQIHVLKAQNVCDVCGEGFVSPKNLTRHVCNNEAMSDLPIKDEPSE